MAPRKVKVSDVEEEKAEDIEADVNVEPLEYAEVVKDLKAEENVEVDCPVEFIIPPAGYKESDEKATGKAKVKKTRAKKKAVAVF